jgi:hypothetical protein
MLYPSLSSVFDLRQTHKSKYLTINVRSCTLIFLLITTFSLAAAEAPLSGLLNIQIMALTYKNITTVEILSKFRNLRYANGEMLFGFNNILNFELELCLDVQHLSLQADVFAREMLTHQGAFDFKRFLGQFREDWLRLLHEAYIYDRLKNVYYGVLSYNLLKVPGGTYSFPGNVILLHNLATRRFEYTTNDSQPYTFQVAIKFNTDIEELFKPIFKVFPDLEEGISYNVSYPSYVCSRYEAILKGLNSARLYVEGRRNSGTPRELFSMVEMNDPRMETFVKVETNPSWNSFLNKEGDKFYFVLPQKDSVPEALRFNESLHLGRAIGMVSKQLQYNGNDFYCVANRSAKDDFLTREEVYSVTGLKSNIVPYTQEQIENYLNYNSYQSDWVVKFGDGGGSDSDSNATP